MSQQTSHEVLNQSGELRFRQARSATVRLAALGDLDLHGPMHAAIERDGPLYPFSGVREILSKADIRVANLETVLVASPRELFPERACLVASLLPIESLRAVGIQVVTFANNHAFDMGPSGLVECVERVAAAGIKVVGAGRNVQEARKSVRIVCNGVEFGFLAYSYDCGQAATQVRPGCAVAEKRAIVEDMRALSPRPSIVVVSLHLDAEFQSVPAPGRIRLCRELADAGADIVLCHHPHVPQGVERWGTSLIAYSLGNYVTPISEYMLRHSAECHLSFQLDVECDEKGVCGATVVPIEIVEDGRPVPAAPDSSARIRTLVAERSALLSDAAEIQMRYRRMLRAWAAETSMLLYWGVRAGNWGLCRRIARDLRLTPTKRRWLRDLLLAAVGVRRF